MINTNNNNIAPVNTAANSSSSSSRPSPSTSTATLASGGTGVAVRERKFHWEPALGMAFCAGGAGAVLAAGAELLYKGSSNGDATTLIVAAVAFVVFAAITLAALGIQHYLEQRNAAPGAPILKANATTPTVSCSNSLSEAKKVEVLARKTVNDGVDCSASAARGLETAVQTNSSSIGACQNNLDLQIENGRRQIARSSLDIGFASVFNYVENRIILDIEGTPLSSSNPKDGHGPDLQIVENSREARVDFRTYLLSGQAAVKTQGNSPLISTTQRMQQGLLTQIDEAMVVEIANRFRGDLNLKGKSLSDAFARLNNTVTNATNITQEQFQTLQRLGLVPSNIDRDAYVASMKTKIFTQLQNAYPGMSQKIVEAGVRQLIAVGSGDVNAEAEMLKAQFASALGIGSGHQIVQSFMMGLATGYQAELAAIAAAEKAAVASKIAANFGPLVNSMRLAEAVLIEQLKDYASAVSQDIVIIGKQNDYLKYKRDFPRQTNLQAPVGLMSDLEYTQSKNETANLDLDGKRIAIVEAERELHAVQQQLLDLDAEGQRHQLPALQLPPVNPKIIELSKDQIPQVERLQSERLAEYNGIRFPNWNPSAGRQNLAFSGRLNESERYLNEPDDSTSVSSFSPVASSSSSTSSAPVTHHDEAVEVVFDQPASSSSSSSSSIDGYFRGVDDFVIPSSSSSSSSSHPYHDLRHGWRV